MKVLPPAAGTRAHKPTWVHGWLPATVVGLGRFVTEFAEDRGWAYSGQRFTVVLAWACAAAGLATFLLLATSQAVRTYVIKRPFARRSVVIYLAGSVFATALFLYLGFAGCPGTGLVVYLGLLASMSVADAAYRLLWAIRGSANGGRV